MPFITADTEVTDEVLRQIAYTPTKELDSQVDPAFIRNLTDQQFMRLAVLLAEKGDSEGGCPIGAVVIDTMTRAILGKGHNRMMQDEVPYWHGETDAIADASRNVGLKNLDLSLTTIFTSLSPCEVCTGLIRTRMVGLEGAGTVVIGDASTHDNSENEERIRQRGINVVILEDQQGIDLYRNYRASKPEQDELDWGGVAAARKAGYDFQ